MPVLKIKKDGVWEELGGTSPADGGNADTLDGKHASEFATTDSVDALNSSITNLKLDIFNLQAKVGDTSVSNQISNAITNKADKHITTTATLSVDGWSNNSQTINISEVTATNTVFTTHAPSGYITYRDCGVRMSAQSAGQLTFECETVPTENITVNIAIFN